VHFSAQADIDKPKAARVTVKNDAPQIIFATTPTLLVVVDGEPAWRPVPGTDFALR